MIKNHFSVFFVFCLIVSCAKQTDKNIIVLGDEAKNSAIVLTQEIPDSVPLFDASIYAQKFLVYQDSIVIVKNRRYEDQYFIEFYNMHTNNLIKKLYRLGNGPDEILSASIYLNGNILTVNDYQKYQVAFINVDSVLQNKLYSANLIRHYYPSPSVVEYNENELLIENPYCFKDDELRIDNKAPRFVITKKSVPYVEKNKYDYYTRNVACDGNIITNHSKNKIFYADFRNSILEIYDYDLNLQKKIIGPEILKPEYTIVENKVIFKKKAPYGYMNYCTDDDYIYLIYFGALCDYSKDENEKDFPTWIFQFNWEGEFVKSYSAGRYISTISIDKDGGFYCTAYDKEYNPLLIKLSQR